MKNNDLISVIVPVYNVEKYLDRCVESIVSQTYKNLEIILIDDGSPDNCPQMCDDWAKKDSRIKVIHKENGGVSSARNCGLDEAKGEYISFVDSDDVIHSQFYEIMAKNIGDADIIYCEYKNFTNEISFDEADNFEIEVNKRNDVFLNPKFSFYIVWNKLIKKNLLNNLRFDTELKNAEDTWFAFKLLSNCNKVVYIKTPLYGYLIRSTGAVGSVDLAGLMQNAYVWKEIYDFVQEKEYGSIKNQVEYSLIYTNINLLYASKGVNQEEYLQCKKYLRSKIFKLLFIDFLSFKEKVVLIFNLYFMK